MGHFLNAFQVVLIVRTFIVKKQKRKSKRTTIVDLMVYLGTVENEREVSADGS